MTTAIATLDERYQPIIGQDKLDSNNYILGRIYEYNIVIIYLSNNIYNINTIGYIANDILR